MEDDHLAVSGIRTPNRSYPGSSLKRPTVLVHLHVSPQRVKSISNSSLQGKEISEEQLYGYTRQRWLKNEPAELAKRYLKFSLPGLIREALAACHGAHCCTQILKCAEGLHNKAFILTMDNGEEILAKLPNPNAGPAHYTTVSEVATRQFLKDVVGLPVPRVLAWCCDATESPVQAECILEERISGARLGRVWRDLAWKAKLGIIDQVAVFDAKLSNVSFQEHGSIYFKADLQSFTGTSSAPLKATIESQDVTLEQYTIGPLAAAELWKSGRERLKIDRGPWKDSEKYSQALGVNEALWIGKNGKSRMNYHRSSSLPELPQDSLQLLAKYDQIAPFLVPGKNDKSAITNTLWHPDLHLDNIFVDPTTHRVTAIIDWQSAVVAPLFYQSGIHRAFRHYKTVREGWYIPEKPGDYDELPVEKQTQVDRDLESETIHKYYELQTLKRVPKHWDLLQRPLVPMLRKPVWLVTDVWENQDLYFLRDSLIDMVRQWDKLFGDDTPCPIAFSKDELEMHAKETENVEGVGEMLKMLQEQGVLLADGVVAPEDYETAIENCKKYKKIFLDATENDEEREMYRRLWPYQDNVEE